MFACGVGDGTLLAGVAAWPEEEVVVEVVATEAPLLVIVEDSAQQ